ncbi:hypothetical protein QCA50_008599 [Cerrena zonata]|uniref:SET domain-containing protein n=1 Tax=Cerrena zonata TaxID=2478898 RepID=A0AAW0G9D7_9APHY
MTTLDLESSAKVFEPRSLRPGQGNGTMQRGSFVPLSKNYITRGSPGAVSYHPHSYSHPLPLSAAPTSPVMNSALLSLIHQIQLHDSNHRVTTTSRDKIKVPSGFLPSPEHYRPAISKDIIPTPLWTTLPHCILREGEPLTDCLLRAGMKETILSIPGFPYPYTNPSPQRYKIKPIRGKGIGMVATVDIDVGDLILVERPLVLMAITTYAVPPESYLQQPARLQEILIERLQRQEYEEFFALHNCKGNTRPHIQGIFDTNSIGIGRLPGFDGQCGAVCKDISRVNHSCSPNAEWRFDVETFTVALRAIAPIKNSEQVFVSYTDSLRPRAERQKHLLERYKFECTCPSCASGSHKSDEARMTLRLINEGDKCEDHDDPMLRDWVHDRTKPDDMILVKCHKTIDLLESEKYYRGARCVLWYQRLAKAYCALEDEDNARKWVQKAAKLARANTGHDAGWDAVVKNPKNTDWWGLRRVKP